LGICVCQPFHQNSPTSPEPPPLAINTYSLSLDTPNPSSPKGLATVYDIFSQYKDNGSERNLNKDNFWDVVYKQVALSISNVHLAQCGNQLGDTVKPLTQAILR
jgi:hypothetical protein